MDYAGIILKDCQISAWNGWKPWNPSADGTKRIPWFRSTAWEPPSVLIGSLIPWPLFSVISEIYISPIRGIISRVISPVTLNP